VWLALSLVAIGIISILTAIAFRPGSRPSSEAVLTLEATAVTKSAATADAISAPATTPAPTLTPIIIPELGIEIPHITDEEEIEIGREAAAQFERDNRVSNDPALAKRVARIGAAIAPHSPRTNIPYTFKILDTDEVNAYALPGGFIYVTRGMLQYVQSDDELAGVIGHEIAHIALRHGAQQIEAIAAVQAAIAQNPDLSRIYQTQEGQIAAEVVFQIGRAGWGRQAELDADEYGTIYMAQAGYDPQAVLDLFRRFAAEETGSDNDPLARLLATHPPFSDRIKRVEQAIHQHGLK
jgi:predicted Zn-dependent protease